MPRMPADVLGRFWKVGELARQTGLTVRTLHHYEAVGLLTPSGRTDSAHSSGHRLYTAADVVSADTFLTTIEEMTMIEKYYTPEQLDYLHKRREEVGEEPIREGPQRWADLSAAVQAEIDAGTDPSDPKVQELARQWFGLVNEFTGGDPSIFNSLRNMYQNEDRIQGMDVAGAWRPMMEYIGRAAAAAGLKIPGK